MSCGDKTRLIKLSGVDCPDLDQPFGSQARDFLVNLIGGREIWVDVERLDHHNRWISKITLNGEDVGVQVVKAGLGWYDTKYTTNPKLSDAQAQARESKSGLWDQDNPVPPWEFRQMRRGIVPDITTGPVSIGHSEYGSSAAADPTVNSTFVSWPAGRQHARGWLTTQGPYGPCLIPR